MVKKVFWENPYLTELTAHILSVNENQITVDQTIFYAFSGGQESDQGWVDDYLVKDAQKDEDDIIYTLEGEPHFQVGDEVRMVIDWNRRYKLMRLHFAAEIILELAYRFLENIEKIGAHISEDKARIDFVWDQNISQTFSMLETAANQLIKDNKRIISAFDDEDHERRYWEVKGFAKVSCGGTHLKTTGEVGKIRLKRVNIGKGKERIEIYLDDKL